MLLSGITSKKEYQRLQYAKMLDGVYPVFSQFGQDVYASDIVQMAIDCIATEISKLQPRHIKTAADGEQTIPDSSINRLFKFSPNQFMTTADFLEKTMWTLYMNYNCFIYPAYELVTDKNGWTRKNYTGFYPLNPIQATFLQDASNTLFVRLDFAGGDYLTIKYDEIIHLRKKYSVNSFMGGGRSGQPDNQALLKVLNINETVIEGLGKAIKTSLAIRGILKINTMLDDEKQQAERKRFEENVMSGKTGILPMDLKGEYVDLKPDPKIIDKDTMEFIQSKILNWYGVPLKILSGDFNDEDYQAWYEKTLERQVISLDQGFSKILFTDNNLSRGHQMVFYHRDMMYLSTKSKLELIKIAGEQGLLMDDQKLQILGYPPLPDGAGKRRTISLNYVSTEIADEYQLKRANAPRVDANKD